MKASGMKSGAFDQHSRVSSVVSSNWRFHGILTTCPWGYIN